MSRPDGTPINAVFGFSKMLMKFIEDLLLNQENNFFGVVLDAGRTTFRNEIYPDYKANRDETPEDLIPQFNLIKESINAFNVPCVEKKGFEADDLIATYCRIAKKSDLHVRIISADKDLMQLVGNNVEMFDPMKQKLIGVEQVIEKFGVPPEKVIDVQALAGDSVDNIPGVPGIGIKTAAQLINEYDNLENLLDNAQEIKQPKRRENLVEYSDLAKISKKLVTLKDDIPLEDNLDIFKWRKPNEEILFSWLKEQGFKSLLNKASAKLENGKQLDQNTKNNNISSNNIPNTKNYTLIQNVQTLKKWMNKCVLSREIAIDTETDGLNPLTCNLIGISISTSPGTACYIPLKHIFYETQASLELDETAKEINDTPVQITLSDALNLLKPVFEDSGILKIGQNIKFDMHVLKRYGINLYPFDDTMLISYVLDGSKHGHGMDELAQLHLQHETIKFTDICGKGKEAITFDKVELETAKNYAAEDSDVTLNLHRVLKPTLVRNHLSRVYERLERPLIPILQKMEQNGIKVDVKKLVQLSKDFNDRAKQYEQEIYQLAGKEFNIGSPKQLGDILYDPENGIGVKGKKTKSGAWATGANILESLSSQGYELPKTVLEWRGLTKLKNTYTDSLQSQINPNTGRIHTTFSQHFTSTGRLSSNEPNLQNIPIRTQDGKKIREAFVADDKMSLLSADYSQIELKLLAHVAKIPRLIEAFHNGSDIHATTASTIFNVPVENMDPLIRRKAKAINFGIIYGISEFGLARQLSISIEEARNFINSYFRQFPEIQTYMEDTKNIAKKKGYVTTIFGRHCQTPGVLDKKANIRSYAERAAINAPIQGGAADIIKRAMIQMPRAIKKSGLKARMLLQVHDELIFEVPDKEIQDTKNLVKAVMSNSANLDVPLTVDVGVGKNWAEAH